MPTLSIESLSVLSGSGSKSRRGLWGLGSSSAVGICLAPSLPGASACRMTCSSGLDPYLEGGDVRKEEFVVIPARIGEASHVPPNGEAALLPTSEEGTRLAAVSITEHEERLSAIN